MLIALATFLVGVCSDGPKEADVASVTVPEGKMAAVVSAYLAGSASLEDVTAMLELPVPEQWPVEHREQWSMEQRELNDEASDQMEQWRTAGYDSADVPKTLSLSELADFFAAREAFAGRHDLRDALGAPQGELWWDYAVTEFSDSFHTYFSSLWTEQLVQGAQSRLWPLFILHGSLYDLLYCMQNAGVDVSGVAGMLVEELYLDGNIPTAEVPSEKLLRSRMAEAGLSRDAVDRRFGECLEGDEVRLWPLPYDLNEARNLRRSEILTSLKRWVADNRHLQPEGLTVVD